MSLINIYNNRFSTLPGPGFEFQEVENEINSLDYLKSISVGENQIHYNSKVFDEYSDGFKFSVGDQRMIRQIVTLVGKIFKQSKRIEMEFWNIINAFYSSQLFYLTNPQKNWQYITKALFNRSKATNFYFRYKYRIEFELDIDINYEYKLSTQIKCPKRYIYQMLKIKYENRNLK